MQRLSEQGMSRMRGGPESLEGASQPSARAAPRKIRRVVISVRHGKSDAARRACFSHEDFRARIRPDTDSRSKFQRTQSTALISQRVDRPPKAAWLITSPRRLPFMDARGFVQKLIDGPRGGAAKDMDLELRHRSPHKRQAYHRVAEVMEFNNEKPGFHRANQRRFSR